MPVRTGGTAPYAPPATVMQAITAFRDRGLTSPITEEVLTRASIPESLAGRTVRSLEGLDLIDKDGKPTTEFEGLRRAPSDEFKGRLEAIIRTVYAEVFQFTDPATDDANKVADAFRAYEPIGQRARMVTLFLGLCAAAGIIAEQEKKPRPSQPKVVRGSVHRDGKKVTSFGGPAGLRVSRGELVGAKGPVPEHLVSLLTAIPFSDGWTVEGRDKFLTAFGHVLDITVPIVTKVAPPDTDGDDDGDED